MKLSEKTPNHIQYEIGDHDAWHCICGNEPSEDGFYPCDAHGGEVEPDQNWDGTSYVCNRCGRIINQDTLEIVGQKADETKLETKKVSETDTHVLIDKIGGEIHTWAELRTHADNPERPMTVVLHQKGFGADSRSDVYLTLNDLKALVEVAEGK